MDPTKSSRKHTKLQKKPKFKRSDSKEHSSSLELKSRYERLVKENGRLDKEIADLESKGVSTDLKPQMLALHEYNEMKDLAQMILGYLADAEQVSITNLHQRFDLPME